MADREDLQKTTGRRPGFTRYRRGRTPDGSLGVRVHWLDEGAGETPQELVTTAQGETVFVWPGDPFLPFSSVEVHALGGGQGYVIQRFRPIRGSGQRNNTELTAWSDRFTVPVERFLSQADGLIKSAGDSVSRDNDSRTVTRRYEVPAAWLFRRQILSSPPADLGSGVGQFVSLPGVSRAVLKHFPDLRERDTDDDGTPDEWEITEVYEWRGVLQVSNKAGQDVDGWVYQTLAQDGTINEVDLREEPN